MDSASVVASILLAFGIDAWWGEREEALREHELLFDLAAEFEASRPGLEDRIVLAGRMVLGSERLLEALEDVGGGGVVVVPDTLLLAVLGGPTYEPVSSALDAAVGSGEIDLIRRAEIRTELAAWRRMLDDTTEDELEVRRITNDQVFPVLSRSLPLGTLVRRLAPWSTLQAQAMRSSEVSVPVTTELIGAVSLRGFYLSFARQDLLDLHDSLERLTALIDEELER